MTDFGKKWRLEPILGEDSSRIADAIVNDDNTAIAINYAPQLERIATSLETTVTSLETIATSTETIATSLETIASAINDEGVVFKDKYASLSYSSLIKVFEEEGIDIDALIAKTQNKLSGL